MIVSLPNLFFNVEVFVVRSFVPYCTSDSWSGTRATPEGMFSFMGAEVLVQIVRDLMPLGLEGARSLLLAGSSAGGTGVMLNLDRIHNLVHHELGTSRRERFINQNYRRSNGCRH